MGDNSTGWRKEEGRERREGRKEEEKQTQEKKEVTQKKEKEKMKNKRGGMKIVNVGNTTKNKDKTINTTKQHTVFLAVIRTCILNPDKL